VRHLRGRDGVTITSPDSDETVDARVTGRRR